MQNELEPGVKFELKNKGGNSELPPFEIDRKIRNTLNPFTLNPYH